MNNKIAIIGMSCRLPGARNVEEYWQVISRHQEAFVEVPASRWDWRQYYSVDRDKNPICYNKAGFIKDIEYFDDDFFNLEAKECQRLDPQQRITLELVWEALESACIIPGSLSGTDTAVIMGVGHNDHARKLKNDFPTFNGAVGLHSYDCFIANRISYFLNLKGPSFIINSACSSSLHAIHIACNMLRENTTQLAICGGINTNLLPDESIDSTLAKWLTPTGRCRSFSEGGDGFVRSEGGGVIILKRLEDAVAHGDPVLGVICGSALGHNGQSNGISAPNGDSQKRLIRRCFTNADLSPHDIDYIEAHGTGSSKGDSIEALSLIDLLDNEKVEKGIFVGCCKPNIGHTEAASGVAGLIKILLCLKHQMLPRISNLEKLNRWIPENSVFLPLMHDQDWPASNQPRRAGLANYAFGGANAFFIIEEHLAIARQAPVFPYRFVCISAKSENVLTRLSSTVATLMPQWSDDMLYTLNCCREQHLYRNVIFDQGSNGIVNYRMDLPHTLNHARIWVYLDKARLLPWVDTLLSLISESVYLRRAHERFANIIGFRPLMPVTEPEQACRYIAAFWVWFCRTIRIGVSLFSASPELAVASLIRPTNLHSEPIIQWIKQGDYHTDLASALQLMRDNGSLIEAEKTHSDISRDFRRFDPLAMLEDQDNSLSSPVKKQPQHMVELSFLNNLLALYLAGHSLDMNMILDGNKTAMPSLDLYNRNYSWFTPSVQVVSNTTTREQ